MATSTNLKIINVYNKSAKFNSGYLIKKWQRSPNKTYLWQTVHKRRTALIREELLLNVQWSSFFQNPSFLEVFWSLLERWKKSFNGLKVFLPHSSLWAQILNFLFQYAKNLSLVSDFYRRHLDPFDHQFLRGRSMVLYQREWIRKSRPRISVITFFPFF